MNGKLAMFGALLAWGGWGFASRLAVANAHPFTVQWLTAIPQIVMLPLWLFLAREHVPDMKPTTSTMVWTLVTCLLTVLATLLYNTAMKSENPSAVIAVTSAYPMVTLLLLVLLGMETFSWTQGAGCLLIIIGVALVQVK